MDQLPWLLCLCIAMFAGAFGSGYIPLSFSMSESRLRMVTIFGAGLLVGTALIVIIPEGIAMHYASQAKHSVHAAALTTGAESSLIAAPGVVSIPTAVAEPVSPAVVTAAAVHAGDEHTTGAEAASAAIDHEHDHSEAGHSHGDAEPAAHEHGDTWAIGAALAIGFAFQLVVGAYLAAFDCRDLAQGEAVTVITITSAAELNIGVPITIIFFFITADRISGGLHSHSHGVAVPASGEKDSGELNVRANTGGDHSAKSKSALMGMVVHAAVDGVALGAAVKEGDSALGLLVFLAIMLHKAPSSFGLSSYLLHHGISHDGVKKRLLLFSSSAPLGAIFTYTLLSINLFTYKQEMLALCLLFSGGTFLYVATAHVLPEIQAGHTPDPDDEDDEEAGTHAEAADGHGHHGHSHGGHRSKHPPRMKWVEVWVMVAGVLLPLLINVHHGH